MAETLDLRRYSAKELEFAQAETEKLLAACSTKAQELARKIIDAQKKERGAVDWRSLHDLAVRTIEKAAASVSP